MDRFLALRLWFDAIPRDNEPNQKSIDLRADSWFSQGP
jgi:hypothetical protein